MTIEAAEAQKPYGAAEAQKLSGIFQTFATGRAVAPVVQDKCNEIMDVLRDELSKNRLKYLDYGIRFRSRRRDIIRNDLSHIIVDVIFLVDDGRRPFPYEVLAASIHTSYNMDKNEYFFVMEKEIGFRIGSGELTEDCFAYLTDTARIPVATPELLGIELRELKSWVWFGNKKATEGRGLRDLVVKRVSRLQDSSFSTIANVTIGFARSRMRKKEALKPL
jgi:hypothetical protein